MTALLFALVAVALTSLVVLLGGLHFYTAIPAYGLIALAGVFSLSRARYSQISKAETACGSASFLFFGYIIARSVVSPDSYIARSDLYMVLAALITYLIFALGLVSLRLRVRLVYLLLLIAVANSTVGGIQFFKGRNFMPFEFLARGDYGARASGFYGCPNHFAGFLEVVMLFGLSLACWSRSSLLIRIAAGYCAAMSLAGIIISGSRGGYASSVVGLLAFGFISLFLAEKWLRREFWYAVIACVALGGVSGAYFLRSVVRESDVLQHRVDSVNSDMAVRASLAKAAFKQFQISPWFGTGSRTYLFYGREFRDSIILGDPIYAHNDYLQLLAEYGIVGFAGMVVFLAFHLRGGFRSVKYVAAEQTTANRERGSMKRSGKGSRSRSAWRAVTDEETKRLEQPQPSFKGSNSLALTVAALCSVIAYLVHSVVDFNLHIPANACLMAFVFAILANPGTNHSTGGQDARTTSPSIWNSIIRFAPAALGLWLIIEALPKWPAELHRDKAKRLLSDWRMLDSVEFATEAEAVARKGLSYDSKNPELYFYVAEAQVLRADLAESPAERAKLYYESITSYKSALSLSPKDIRYVIGLASSLDALELYSEAETMLDVAVKLDPNSGKPRTAYALHFHQQKKIEEAAEQYELAAKLTNAPAEWTRLYAIRKEAAERKAQQGKGADTPK